MVSDARVNCVHTGSPLLREFAIPTRTNFGLRFLKLSKGTLAAVSCGRCKPKDLSKPEKSGVD
jgi:hypothetical protein